MGMSDQKDRGERVKLGRVKQLTTKSGGTWFVGNMGGATKIVLLPARRQRDDDGSWETVPDTYEVFLQAKTADEIARDREFWDGKRNGGGNESRESKERGAAVREAPARRSAAPSATRSSPPAAANGHHQTVDDQIPF